MKTRIGFVSNSSSSSFVVKKEGLSGKDIKLIDKWDELAKSDYPHDKKYIDDWHMTEDDEEYKFSTYMDNFNLIEYFEKELEIDIQDISW